MKTIRKAVVISSIIIGNFFLSEGIADEPERYQLKTVVIDAGHGGKDSGARGSKSMEKDIVLSVALKLGEYIEESFPEVNVIYTRKTDVFIPLHERAEIANKNHADLFISIHANANTKSSARGTETFAMGLHKTESNLEVAKLENSAILLEDDYSTAYEGFDPNSIESYIVFELMQNIHLDQSLNFAAQVQDQFKNRAKRIDRGVKQAGFLVLWRTSMPSVLIELGFITNSDEEKYLMSEQGQNYLASAIYRAFKGYKQQVDQKSVYEVEVTETAVPEELPVNDSGVRFHIQVISSSNQLPVSDRLFKIYDDVKEIKVDERFKYAVGNADSYKEIKEFAKEVSVIYPDAFVIATEDNTIIPLKEAIKKSKEFRE
jgi:N-acetylmuramoyl-L-alanine amidase